MKTAVAIVVIAFAIAAAVSCDLARRQDVFRVKRTQAALESVGLALIAYRAAHGAYPTASVDSDDTLVRSLVGPFITGIPSDAWGGRLRYLSNGAHYVLWSNGADGKVQRVWWSPLARPPDGPVRVHDVDRDIVLSDGVYVQVLDGVAAHPLN